MENKKLLNGSLDKNIVMGISWLVWIFGLVVFIIDFKTLDLEEKREFVSIFTAIVIGTVLCFTIIGSLVSAVIAVFIIIKAIKSFMGKDFKIPVISKIAAAIIK